MAKHRSSKISEKEKTQLTLSHCDSKGYILHKDFWLLFRNFFLCLQERGTDETRMFYKGSKIDTQLIHPLAV